MESGCGSLAVRGWLHLLPQMEGWLRTGPGPDALGSGRTDQEGPGSVLPPLCVSWLIWGEWE